MVSICLIACCQPATAAMALFGLRVMNKLLFQLPNTRMIWAHSMPNAIARPVLAATHERICVIYLRLASRWPGHYWAYITYATCSGYVNRTNKAKCLTLATYNNSHLTFFHPDSYGRRCCSCLQSSWLQRIINTITKRICLVVNAFSYWIAAVRTN